MIIIVVENQPPHVKNPGYGPAHLQGGVLEITVPKFSKEKKRQHKVINVAEERSSGEDIKATKARM